MKIGIVLSQPPGYSETFFNSKIEGLQKNGFEVTLFCQNNGVGFNTCKVKRFSKTTSNPIIQLLYFFKVYMVLLPYIKKVMNWYSLESKHGVSKLKFLKKVYINAPILKADLDWLHFGFGTLALERETLAKAIVAKMAVSFRGFDIGIYPLKNPNCYQKLWKHLDKLHVISEDIHSLAAKQGLPETIPVTKITPAIDLEFFNTEKTENLSTMPICKMITVGRLHWKKGYEEALLALKIVKYAGYQFQYKIIGEGDEYERIAYAAYELGLKDEVLFLGKLSREEVKKNVEEATVYLQYSIQEGFCNSVLEAQALGKLCIVSNAEGLSENVLNNKSGWVVPKLQHEQLAQKIIEVIEMPAEQKKNITSFAKRRIIEEFNIKKQQQEFVEFYKN